MKKLLLFALLAVMMAGCEEERVPNKSKKIENVYNAYTCEIDSCEYILQGYGLAHKGNCRFCEERRKAELRGIG